MGIGWQPSAYTGAEVKCFIRYGEYDLLEVQDVEYSVDRSARPGGAGLGHPRNRYHKRGVPSGEWKISKNYLNIGYQADLFAQLIAGTQTLQSEALAADVFNHTTTRAIVSVLYVRLTTGRVLYEGIDYVVDYETHTIYFNAITTAGVIVYITDGVALADDAMEGLRHPFVFDVEWRERDSGTVLKRLRGCMPYTHSMSSGGDEEAFTEDLEGEFLAVVTRPIDEVCEPYVLLDAFNRTDGALGDDWLTNPLARSSGGAPVIVDGQASTTDGLSEVGAYWLVTPEIGGFESVYFTKQGDNANVPYMLLARLRNPEAISVNGYMALIGSSTVGIYRIDDYETFVQLNEETYTVNIGDVVRFELVADGLSVVVGDGVTMTEVCAATDVTYAAGGRVGFEIGVYNPGSPAVGAIDDFGGGIFCHNL